MLNKPKFKSCFQVEIVESLGIFLLSETDSFLLKGNVYEKIAPLIDGTRTINEIVDLLEGQASTAEIYYALMQMEQNSYLVETYDNIQPSITAFCDSLNVAPQEAFPRWQTIKVVVHSFSLVPREKFIHNLEALNIQVSNEGNIEVVLTDDYLQDDLEAFNQKALQSQRPWMLVKPIGKIIWIGPIFIPGKTGCWECLAQRLRTNRPVEQFIWKSYRIATSLTKPFSVIPFNLQTGLNLAATEVAKWIVRGENQQLDAQVVTFDTISLETQNHLLVKRPQCPCCGKQEVWGNREPTPVVLNNRKKTLNHDGGYRFLSSEETLKKYEHHISPITGVVRWLKKIPQQERPLIHTYIVGHHFATMFDDLYSLRQNVCGRSSGKGKTDTQAKTSGLCEAIERYSGVFQEDEIRRKGTYQQMSDVAIHPNECMNFSQRQYENRQKWNAQADLNHWIPEPFDETREIDWTPVWSLTNQTFKYLPTAYCYYGYPNSDQPDCWANSNGCSAGNTLEEAILQGVFELVERDSVALWWYNRLKKPEVNLESFDDPYFQALKDYYQTFNREFWVLDLTSDFNIPVFGAISRRTDSKIEDIIFGFGAHFNPYIAMLRALTELNQALPSVSSINPDDSTRYESFSKSALNWWKTASLQNQNYLVPNSDTSPTNCSDYPHLWQEDLLEDVMICSELIKEKSMEMLILDQTRPDIGLNVVKVIVPGMRHYWRRLGAGRLYDVPVKLGWLEESNTENQLNPLAFIY
ncbi:MAG: TOMM precursor leader peptide-binding protein [Cyanobacteria bacterium P01_G01_bin.39]